MCKRYALINPAFLSVAWTYHCVVTWDVAWDAFFYTGTTLWPLPTNKTKIWSSWHTSASCTSSKLWMEADWHISIDMVGPLPCTDKGNKYIIVVTDYFTKWPEACATPTKEAIHVANFLFDLFLLVQTSPYRTKERYSATRYVCVNIYNHNQIYVHFIL